MALTLARQTTIILSFTLGKVELIHIFFGVTITMIAIPQVILVRARAVRPFWRNTPLIFPGPRSSGSGTATWCPSFAF